jgi:hypothetical protein
MRERITIRRCKFDETVRVTIVQFSLSCPLYACVHQRTLIRLENTSHSTSSPPTDVQLGFPSLAGDGVEVGIALLRFIAATQR